MKTILASLLLLATLPVTAPAADKNTESELTVHLQMRPRAEYRNGALAPHSSTDQAAAFINNRTRLTLSYQTQGLSMGLALQNAGVWGQDVQVSRNPNTNVYEAWAQLTSPGGWFLKAGRQVLAYDDERILGALDWNPAGRSHDLLKGGFEDKTHKLHLALAYNQNTEKVIGGTYYATAQPYKTMQMLWYQYNGSPVIKPSFLLMNLGIEIGSAVTGRSEVAAMQTIGTHWVTQPTDHLGVNLSAYYQLGKTRTNATIEAWMMALQANLAIGRKWTATAGTDFLSGEETINNNATYNAFNPLYGTHHKFYGAMDYFYASAFRANLNPGLWDSYAGLTHQASKNLTLSAKYHYFAITSDINDNGRVLKRGLGSEIDLQFDWTIRKEVRLSGGYSTMLGSASMDIVKGPSHTVWQDWGWISINFNPRILSLKH
ncbi:MAG: alginate export family protein [Bacteroidales bacterium]|nr:alginate export family protein [Bacteroidales bacterium]